MANLKDILYNTSIVEVVGITEKEIKHLACNSKKVKKGSVFAAIKGIRNDGHSFIHDAIQKGAVAIICELIPDEIDEATTYIRVKNSAKAFGIVTSNFYDNPSSRLKLIGITGTNGKTTIAVSLFRLFQQLGYKTGMISTIQNQINERIIPAEHTTPDTLMINKLLSDMLDDGCTHCFMEVSSHAISQDRIAGLEFTGAVFTNITHEHLDYHHTFDDYLQTKKMLFDNLPGKAFALVNIDDKHGSIMLQNTKGHKYTLSLNTIADFKARILENNFSGLFIKIDEEEISTKFIGEFNAYNLLSIYAIAALLGEDKQQVFTLLSNLDPAEGRFDYNISKNKVIGIVDFAHTPDALMQVLNTINEIKVGKEKVITIIGCGGDRDKSKRPKMAKIASELSDNVILTSDNPRSESPEAIIKEMKKGIKLPYIKKVLSITDRQEAIKTACSLADEGDIILLAGKGHEKYQEVKGVKHSFDDKKVLMESLKLLENNF